MTDLLLVAASERTHRQYFCSAHTANQWCNRFRSPRSVSILHCCKKTDLVFAEAPDRLDRHPQSRADVALAALHMTRWTRRTRLQKVSGSDRHFVDSVQRMCTPADIACMAVVHTARYFPPIVLDADSR